jgi:catechol 2,3-dioxygenase-like lactoylglutathione lyase family enzyme
VVTGIAHVCFRVADLEASLAFYTEQLGLTRAFDFRNDAGERTGVYLHVGGRNFIELFEGVPAARDDAQSYRHLCLEVDDMKETLAALRAWGVESTEMELGGDGAWQAWITDPDGNPIELHQYTDTSLQTARLS